MPMTTEQVGGLLKFLGGQLGLPSTFNGDRLAAFNYGMFEVLRKLGPMVTLDKPLPEKREKPAEPAEEPAKE